MISFYSVLKSRLNRDLTPVARSLGHNGGIERSKTYTGGHNLLFVSTDESTSLVCYIYRQYAIQVEKSRVI